VQGNKKWILQILQPHGSLKSFYQGFITLNFFGKLSTVEHKSFIFCFNGKVTSLLNLLPMKKNMGSLDKLIRLLAAIVLIVLFYTNVLKDTLGVIALVVALVFTITSLISFCPLYTLFGIKTCQKEE
jgi:hypothetical protein